MVLSFIFKEEFKMENNFTPEELLERMKQAANAQVPSSTLDILNQMRNWQTIAVESKRAALTLKELKDIMPEHLHEEIDDKIGLMLEWSEAALKVHVDIRNLMPLAQRLDVATNLTKEQIKDIIKEIEEMDD